MGRATWTDHLILWIGCFVMLGPLVLLVMTSTHGGAAQGPQILPGPAGLEPYRQVLFQDELFGVGVTAADMLKTSLIVALGIAGLKTVCGFLAAYALVYFRVPARSWLFGAILLSMFFPVETRILPSFLVVSQLGMLNSYAGLILPVTATGIGVLILRQGLLQLPDDLLEAAKLDGAGPIRFMVDILLPVSLPALAALFVLMFVVGWNQYLWPIMVTTANSDMFTLVRGMERVGIASGSGFALAVLAILPPLVVMLLAQRLIVRGLVAAIR